MLNKYYLYRIKFLITGFFLLSIGVIAQNGAVFDSFPKDRQLYQRNDSNQGVVSIKGTYLNYNYAKLSLIVHREDINGVLSYKKIPLNFQNNKAAFNENFAIEAGLYNYTFDLYAVKESNSDSVLVLRASKITCGDVIMIYGQSNASATADIPNYSWRAIDFCRVLYIDFFQKEFVWNSLIENTAVHIGSTGAELARLIIEKYKMPVAVFNGAVGSASIVQLSDRDPKNLTNPETRYGQFLSYAVYAEVAKTAKILLWRQGEAEAMENEGMLIGQYPERFKALYDYWKTDFPALKKIYVFQNNILGNPDPYAGILRDFQRRMPDLYSNIQPVATVGTVFHDGIHYTTPGYVQSAVEVFREIAQDFYGEKPNQNVYSPNIKKAYFNANRTEITLKFDDNQSLVQVPKDSIIGNPLSPIKVWRLKDYIYLDGASDKISEISINGNQSILYLKEPSDAQTITYMPAYFNDYDVTHTYQGLYYKNALGMRALTFDSFPIENAAIVAAKLRLNNVKSNLTNLSLAITWDNVFTNISPTVIIERSVGATNNYVIIATLKNNELSYTDKDLQYGTTYNYRIKAINSLAESDYTFFVVNIPLAPSVNFDSFPSDWQLYQRDSTNKAVVEIKGKLITKSNGLSLMVYRADKPNTPYYYEKIKPTFINSSADFTFSPKINAGLINYTFSLYTIDGKDSTLLSSANNVTCGDVIMIYGQSNAQAFPDIINYPYTNDFCRALYIDYVANRSAWNYQFTGTAVHTGSMGAEIARLITEKYKIPVAVFNGGVGSTGLIELADRDANNPTNPKTNYGKFLAYAVNGQLDKKAKILLWRQGENEALENTGTLVKSYPAYFTKLYSDLKTDLPALKKIYSFQNNIYGSENPYAGVLRDFQRKQVELYPEIQTIATVGTVTFDGLHYKTPGYIQSATEVFRAISRDFYGEQNSQNFDSPTIKKAIYNNKKATITLVFDEKQTLVQVPADSIVGNMANPIKIWRLKDYIYLDGKPDKIDKITMEGNRTTLYLKDTLNTKTITYLPSFFGDYALTHTYEGLFIKNSLGMRALTFDSYPIAGLIKLTNVRGLFSSVANAVIIDWVKIDNATISIERAEEGTNNFILIAKSIKNINTFTDKNIQIGKNYQYRIKAENELSESEYVTFAINTLVVLNNENEENQSIIYPNPSLNKVYLSPQLNYKMLSINDIEGNNLGKYEDNRHEIDMSHWDAGVYFIVIVDNKNNKIVKKIIKE